MEFWMCKKCGNKTKYDTQKCVKCGNNGLDIIIPCDFKVDTMTTVYNPSVRHQIVPYNVLLLKDEYGNFFPKKTFLDYKIGEKYDDLKSNKTKINKSKSRSVAITRHKKSLYSTIIRMLKKTFVKNSFNSLSFYDLIKNEKSNDRKDKSNNTDKDKYKTQNKIEKNVNTSKLKIIINLTNAILQKYDMGYFGSVEFSQYSLFLEELEKVLIELGVNCDNVYFYFDDVNEDVKNMYEYRVIPKRTQFKTKPLSAFLHSRSNSNSDSNSNSTFEKELKKCDILFNIPLVCKYENIDFYGSLFNLRNLESKSKIDLSCGYKEIYDNIQTKNKKKKGKKIKIAKNVLNINYMIVMGNTDSFHNSNPYFASLLISSSKADCADCVTSEVLCCGNEGFYSNLTDINKLEIVGENLDAVKINFFNKYTENDKVNKDIKTNKQKNTKKSDFILKLNDDEKNLYHSGILNKFVIDTRGSWNHDDWLNLVNIVRQKKIKIKEERIGKLLEKKREELYIK